MTLAVTPRIPAWMLEELAIWIDRGYVGSVAFHTDGRKFTKVERRIYKNAPID